TLDRADAVEVPAFVEVSAEDRLGEAEQPELEHVPRAMGLGARVEQQAPAVAGAHLLRRGRLDRGDRVLRSERVAPPRRAAPGEDPVATGGEELAQQAR